MVADRNTTAAMSLAETGRRLAMMADSPHVVELKLGDLWKLCAKQIDGMLAQVHKSETSLLALCDECGESHPLQHFFNEVSLLSHQQHDAALEAMEKGEIEKAADLLAGSMASHTVVHKIMAALDEVNSDGQAPEGADEGGVGETPVGPEGPFRPRLA